MFSLSVNIGKKHHALMKAWARVASTQRYKRGFVKKTDSGEACDIN